MEKCVERIWQAIHQKEKICIYGDYDADAVTASAVLRQTFGYLGLDTESYIPDRFAEGYGVNLDALEKIRQAETKLVITVDCGTNSLDATEFCKQNNIDLIITDHHEIVGETPKAFGLINPKNPQDTYPYREITGVGVVFKLACALLERAKVLGLRVKFVDGWEKWLLDLVAIGTVADCHSLLGENRILVKYGLKVLAKTRWVGLSAICASAGLNFQAKNPDTYTLGFVLAPRLNAAGRLEHANIALNALLESNFVSAQQKASVLEEINSRRQSLTQNILSEARERAELIKTRKILVLMKENWPKGVVGLVAGKLAEEFNKPTIVLSQEGETSTGSARTVGEFNILEAIKFAGEYLEKFGGHKQAAGLSLKPENFEKFYEKLLEYAEEVLPDGEVEKVLHLEAELFAEDLTPKTYNLISSLEPFGVDNISPKFLVSQAQIISMRLVGKTQTHLQMRVKKNQTEIDSIGFNLGFFAKTFKVGDTIDIACELIYEVWNGQEKVKLKIIDIKNSL
jgi:single-stranded-DNA-specific exonuclease